ncbi:mucin TcMUCII [Trypanosoma cruzi]|uniref:Putative mucin TcMUCII n=1 Tax=Trypanosoma cruzi TaxID=5693 RepID=A0A2V2V989_TRYCR|nr:mucin TcMUCII [Trypanosoma cruzi cruzi]PWU93067.1 putative mucin TcMUCII [Trypanosoma cruzi]RNE98292.1 mucin TcMUCII [Trypanosoma cruzi]
MTTCRLLCALLVLALCCCLSVCGTAVVVEGDNSGELSDPTKPNPPKSKPEEVSEVTQLPSTTPLPPKVIGGGKVTAESQGDLIQEQEEKPTNEEADGDETDKAKDQNQKTNAINTTTTTTTTTTEAPTTTTTSTEAPTTTTTRAPSRLREGDGSLSSSAWMCAPLLLAVSALAYTTLG